MRQRSNRGSIMVEFVVALPIFAIVLFVGMQLALVAFKAASLNFVLTKGARWAILGETTNGDSRLVSIENKIKEFAGTYNISLSDQEVYVCPPNTPYCLSGEENTFNGGPQGEYVQYSARIPVATFFGSIRLQLAASTLGKNELFD